MILSLSPWDRVAGVAIGVGPSKKRSKPRKGKPGWISTRSGIHRLVQAHHAGQRFPDRDPVKKGGHNRTGDDLIALGVPEIRRLLIHLIWTETPDPDHVPTPVRMAPTTPTPSP
jgi:hypothetical protein